MNIGDPSKSHYGRSGGLKANLGYFLIQHFVTLGRRTRRNQWETERNWRLKSKQKTNFVLLKCLQYISRTFKMGMTVEHLPKLTLLK